MTLTTALVADAITATTPSDATARVCANVKASCLARMASRYGRRGEDRLSRCLSELLRLQPRDEDLQIASYGDCTGLLWDGLKRRQVAVVQRYYDTPAQVQAELAARVSAKADYQLSMLLVPAAGL